MTLLDITCQKINIVWFLNAYERDIHFFVSWGVPWNLVEMMCVVCYNRMGGRQVISEILQSVCCGAILTILLQSLAICCNVYCSKYCTSFVRTITLSRIRLLCYQMQCISLCLSLLHSCHEWGVAVCMCLVHLSLQVRWLSHFKPYLMKCRGVLQQSLVGN